MPWGSPATVLAVVVGCSSYVQAFKEKRGDAALTEYIELGSAIAIDADEGYYLMQQRLTRRARHLQQVPPPSIGISENKSHASTTAMPEAEKKVEEEAKSAVNKAAEVAGSSRKGAPQVEEAKQKAIEKVEAVEPDHRWNIWRTVFQERQAERRHTIFACSLLPFGTMILASVLPVVFMRGHVSRNDAAQGSRSVYLVLTFVLTLNYTIVILDSYDFCTTLGLSQATSGRMVGTYMLGACVGSAAIWGLQRWRRELWKETPRAPLMVGFLFQLLGAILYCWVAMQGTDSASKTVDLPLSIATVLFGLGDKPWLSRMLMSSRFFMGIGSGSCQQFFVSSMLHITPVAERAEHTSRWVFSGMIALGAGPLVAAALQALDLCKRWPRFDLVGYAQVFFVFTALTCVAMLPSLKDVKDCLQTEEPRRSTTGPGATQDVEPQPRTGSRILVVGCLAMAGLRAFSVAAIEVALALKLEETYHWDQRVTGLVTGAVFLCCIPLRVVHSVWGKNMSVLGWIRLFSSLSIIGSLLLFSSACELLAFGAYFGQCSYVLIAAGVVLFPCLYLSDALCSGLMHQHVLPEGSLLDANHAQLWFMLAIGLGRFTGPWLARFTLQKMGQDSFALEQLAITCSFLLAFELIVKPFVSPNILTLMKQQSGATASGAD